MEQVTEVGTVSQLGKALTVGANAVSETLRRQTVGGMIGGSIYGLVWGELSNMLNSVLGLDISSTPSFNDRMYGYMFRLMAINKFEKELTLGLIASGAYAGGNPDGLPLNALFPLYSNVVSDYPSFVRNAASNELNGIDSTTKTTVNGKTERTETVNLYPDDLDIGTFTDKWQVDNRNSILHKTKNLFNKGKINSLISRFGTNADGQGDIDYNGKVGYSGIGSSRGRNLKRAPNSGEYEINGYNNPYCRVWTHHHQYDKYSKAIRPFNTQTVLSSKMPDGTPLLIPVNDNKYETMKKLHTWNNDLFDFKEGELKEGKDGAWGWKNENPEWKHSVLSQQDGVVNIAPKYDENGTIHTKDCMFSLENLAWKNYNPYEFENALSWEQRGPLGGRIMWFPPYGISFTENTSVQWNESTFIGRGENVYTYTNTIRSGTLSFMMLTDHPSITDYVSWWTDSEKVDDDMWNRFFAGCDSLNGKEDRYSLLSWVNPTPMDYVFESKDEVVEELVNQLDKKDDVPTDAESEITFFTFFPNNYSGNTDNNTDFSIGYLLAGVGAQMNYTAFGQWDNIPISFKRFEIDSTHGNIGYEMRNSGITNNQSYNKIVGCKNSTTMSYGNNGWNGVTVYEPDNNKNWEYRIDGSYSVPQGNNIWKNNYAQTLSTANSYKDTRGTSLNTKIAGIPTELVSDKKNLYSFGEVAYTIASKKDYVIKTYLSSLLDSTDDERMQHLASLLENKVEEITVEGFANSQGHSQANDVLASSRGKLILNWLKTYLNCKEAKIQDAKVQPVSTKDENAQDAKIYRCAKCTIRFKNDNTEVSNKENDGFDTTDMQRAEAISQTIGVSLNTVIETTNNSEIGNEQVESLGTNAQPQHQPADTTQQQRKGQTTGVNKIRYDNEMFFYKRFQTENPFKWKALTEKLQYFDPAFHSMTPEGFNMRLTFLQQCTRQGDTISASDPNAKTASNMAFGRPPFCVLRLGDFFNQMIVIKSLNIVYDDDGALTWDLNDEGIGAQPMIAKVTIGFDFIGGGDLAGPVRRLQNAMSFNYYANASLYDNRADRMYYEAEENLSTAMGGNGNNKPSLPEKDENGNIISKKGTYSVYHTISKDSELVEEAKKIKETAANVGLGATIKLMKNNLI